MTADDIIMKTEAEKVNGDGEEDEKRVRAVTLAIAMSFFTGPAVEAEAILTDFSLRILHSG